MSAEEPLCRVLENSIHELCAAVERGGRSSDAEQRDRVLLLRILISLPLTCRALRDEAGQHESHAPLLFYERVRLGLVNKSYFLDGVPSSVTLFAGETSITLPDEQLRKLRLKSMVADKFTTIMKLENCTPARRAELVREHSPADLAASVPGAVRVFIARCRAVCKGVRRVRDASMFAQCGNANCGRLFYVGAATECWANADVALALSDSEESSSVEYWNSAACDPGVHVPTVRRFCCSACEREFGVHLARAMPGVGLQFDADNAAVKSGRARVGEALKLALKRNEKASRQLRLLRSAKRARLAVSDAELAVLAERHTAALNVDLGVLYAASVVAESSVLSRGKLLPGSRIYWRDDPSYYSRALSVVREIYFKHRRKEGVVHSLLTVPRFLQLVGDKAAKML
jgi:hypothetical protein